MAFANPTRLLQGRSIAGVRLQGFCTANDDTKIQNASQIQRVQVRIPDLDDATPTSMLPWYATGNLPHYGGQKNIGNQGKIPVIGSKVWVQYNDDSRYFGHYIGAVQNTPTKIPNFSNNMSGMSGGAGGAGGDSSSGGGGGSSESSGSGGSGSNSMSSGMGKYVSSYPQAYGQVDPSGNVEAVDTKRDWVEFTHIMQTSHQIDGKGNVSYLVNGGAQNQNQDATAQFANGMTMAVFGAKTLYISGGLTVSVVGDTAIVSKGKINIASVGDATIQSKGKLNVISTGDALLSSKGNLSVSAGKTLKLQGQQITASTEITLGKGTDPGDPKADFKTQNAPQPGTRPTMQSADNPPESSGSGGDATAGTVGGGD